MTLQTLAQTCLQLVHLHLKIHTLCSIHTQRHAYKPYSWFTCTYKSIHFAQSTCKAVLTNPTIGSITYENAHILRNPHAKLCLQTLSVGSITCENAHILRNPHAKLCLQTLSVVQLHEKMHGFWTAQTLQTLSVVQLHVKMHGFQTAQTLQTLSVGSIARENAKIPNSPDLTNPISWFNCT